MTHRNFWVFRVHESTLRLKAEVDSSSRGQEDFICKEEKRKATWGHAVGLETSGPMGQNGNWVL
jgi:hypothetical protein